jgi:hypothetical protein
MSATNRGGAAVGRLADLAPVEAGAVMYLRLWSDGAHGRDDAASDFNLALGTEQGCAAMMTLEQICMLCAKYSRRPMIRHGLSCSCLGADENCFAQMIGAASDGDREDAMLMASLLVRADYAPSLAVLSEKLGLALRRMVQPQSYQKATHLSHTAVVH